MILGWMLLATFAVINGENDTSCKLENGQIGTCIKIRECPLSDTGDICGFFGDAVAVCCHLNSTQEVLESKNLVPLTRTDENIANLSETRCKNTLLREGGSKDVYNGRLARAKEFRHMAVLGYGEEDPPVWACGGSLISDTHVLTAAHCLTREYPSVIRLGDLDLSNSTEDAFPQDFKVKKVHIFDGYQLPAKYHDIAIIELDRSANRSQYTDIACLDSTKHRNESDMWVMGWGKTGFAGKFSDGLLVATVSQPEFEICKSAYGWSNSSFPKGIIDEFMICAGGKSDTCNGDSGGPLIVVNENLTSRFHRRVYNIAGVTSFGKACGLTSHPGVYTRVQYYIPWIEKIIQGSK